MSRTLSHYVRKRSDAEHAVIRLTRLSGHEFWLNADLIESMEATPDTVIVLVDGRRLVVRESPALVAQMYVGFRAAILIAAGVSVLGEAQATHVGSDALAVARGSSPRHPAITDFDPDAPVDAGGAQ